MNRNFKFRVEAPLIGYQQGRRAAFEPRRIIYKATIRDIADIKGVPREITRKDLVEMWMEIYWVKTARIDWTNIYKIIEDSLWRQDRRTLGGGTFVYPFSGKEYADVMVSWKNEQEMDTRKMGKTAKRKIGLRRLYRKRKLDASCLRISSGSSSLHRHGQSESSLSTKSRDMEIHSVQQTSKTTMDGFADFRIRSGTTCGGKPVMRLSGTG